MTPPGRRSMTNPDATTTTAWEPEKALYSDGAFRGVSVPVLAPTGSAVQRVPDTPFVDPATGTVPDAHIATAAEVEAFRNLMRSARIPGPGGRYEDMARTAVADLYALMLPNGAVQGAGSPYWAFVWPRDTAFVVVALALLDLYDDAWRVLSYVYSMQEPDGQWEARYLPDCSGTVPDERGRQDDGIGYTLWAAWVLTELSPSHLQLTQPAGIRAQISNAITAAGEVLDDDSGLPRTSQDFWEMDQQEPSLGVAGPLLLGLRAGAALADRLDEPEVARQARTDATRLRSAITREYGANGYQHFPSGGGRDASVVFLLSPFLADDLPGARQAWDASRTEMQVSNGGLRPGAQWPDPETAWGPQISLYSIVAAALGEDQIARGYLDWLDAHRTRLGSLPEKVTASGQPAAVAPISTVASAVLIALCLLEGYQLPVPPGSP